MCQNQSNIPTLENFVPFFTENENETNEQKKKKLMLFFCFRFHFVWRIVPFVCYYVLVVVVLLSREVSRKFLIQINLFSNVFYRCFAWKMVRNHWGNACGSSSNSEIRRKKMTAKDKLLHIQIHFGSQHSISCMQNCHFKLQMESRKKYKGEEEEGKNLFVTFELR